MRGAELRRAGGKAVFYLFLAAIAVPFLYPFWWMIISSFKSIRDIFGPLTFLPPSVHLENYLEVFRFQPFARHYFNSVYIAVLGTMLTLFLGSLSGYAFARIRFPGRQVLFLLLLSSLMMPVEVTIIPNFFLMRALNWINSHLPLIVIPVFGMQGSIVTFMMRQFYITVPESLSEAPRLDGLGEFGVFTRVMLPISAPAISSALILTFLHNWERFLEPLVFINDLVLFTLPLSLNNYNDPYGAPMWHLQLAATTMAAVPILIIYIVFQKRIIDAMVFSGLKE